MVEDRDEMLSNLMINDRLVSLICDLEVEQPTVSKALKNAWTISGF